MPLSISSINRLTRPQSIKEKCFGLTYVSKILISGENNLLSIHLIVSDVLIKQMKAKTRFFLYVNKNINCLESACTRQKVQTLLTET